MTPDTPAPGDPERVDTHVYWDARWPFYQVFDVLGRRILENYMKQRIRETPWKTLVDVGCGSGELFPTWMSLGLQRVVGLDFAESGLKLAAKRIGRHGYPIELKQLDLREKSLEETFDVAVTRTVLMHIESSRIEAALANLSKMSNTLLLFEYYEEVRTKELNRWCWLHDYPTLLRDLGYELVQHIQRPDLAQVLFHFQRDGDGSENGHTAKERHD